MKKSNSICCPKNWIINIFMSLWFTKKREKIESIWTNVKFTRGSFLIFLVTADRNPATCASSSTKSIYRMHINRIYAGRPGIYFAAKRGFNSKQQIELLLLLFFVYIKRWTNQWWQHRWCVQFLEDCIWSFHWNVLYSVDEDQHSLVDSSSLLMLLLLISNYFHRNEDFHWSNHFEELVPRRHFLQIR